MLSSNWQTEIPNTVRKMTAAHYAILESSLRLRGKTERCANYALQVSCIDAAVALLSKGKWLYGRATGELADFSLRSSSRGDLLQAQNAFNEAIQLARQIDSDLDLAARAANRVLARVARTSSETFHFDTIPLVPSICPVVVLAGSNRQMGYQFAVQCLDIFGPFVFAVLARRKTSDTERDILQSWAQELKRHTPAVLDMAAGLAEGCQSQGIHLTTDQAIALWTGLTAPADKAEPIGVLDAEGGGVMGAYFGDLTAAPDSKEGLCSGAAAWGSATPDGRMHFAASTDHDCTFQVTIFAYPENGYPYVYTPFSVNGSVPGVGRFGFAGHPGFNTTGLTYVHHGGGGGLSEPCADWGYGPPRGATTMHLLQYGDTLGGAFAWEAALPTGDVGHILGHPGGFYADKTGAYVLEARLAGGPIARTKTANTSGGKHDFLYATNNALCDGLHSPIFNRSNGFDWSAQLGWFPNQNAPFDTSDPGKLTRLFWAESSASRNQYLYDILSANDGSIDLDVMLGMFRKGPKHDTENWHQTEKALSENLLSRDPSVGHRLNAFVGAGTPDERLYRGAIGPVAHRSVSPNRPGHGYFLFDETNTYWELVLEDTPHTTLSQARRSVDILLTVAQAELANTPLPPDGQARLSRLLEQALNAAKPSALESTGLTSGAPTREISRQLRQLCSAQVRCRQILEALSPPEEWQFEKP